MFSSLPIRGHAPYYKHSLTPLIFNSIPLHSCVFQTPVDKTQITLHNALTTSDNGERVGAIINARATSPNTFPLCVRDRGPVPPSPFRYARSLEAANDNPTVVL